MSEYLSTISNEELKELPACLFGGKVEIVDHESKVTAACRYLSRFDVLGFDTETKPSFQAGVTNPVALIQISTADRCFLFRICRMKFHKDIIRLLSDKRIRKVGVDVKGDLVALQRIRRFRPAAFVDLQNEVENYGIEEKSLRKMAAIVLGQYVSKAQRLSNWQSPHLTQAQINYAATDAWACLEIYKRLSENNNTK
ncbi:MAG: 3'-5' exonuclease domain-containing protein 2 [Tidjanibacter sp.]|nr:3'-5' exonuclease domain-containing protein 2 [Tidjanibacter sp.]